MPESPLQNIEEKNVFSKLEKRIQFGVGQIHLATDLLMGINTVDIRQNISDYRDKEGLWQRSFIWEGVKHSRNEKEISPMLWWKELRGTCVLADVGVRILGALVTFAATERLLVLSVGFIVKEEIDLAPKELDK
ncbi:unnamed protein product [Psylliodes chrysocephalus]|uniref:Uncharacterized protein n=1 Tax=Psylliodes chrysocephalus TaxID=3402493 RepID=A0A9P0GJ94_9CUCU|nr:unnamed protein product [Psylliodes chrysocephala]